MKLKTRLIAIVAIPVVGICVLSGVGISAAWSNLRAAEHSEKIVDAALLLGDIVHEMQVERGLSAGFISSSGNLFSSDLTDQRRKVDTALANFRAYSSNIFADYQAESERLRTNFEDFDAMRSQVSGLSTTTPTMAAYYTNAVRSVIELNEVMLSDIDAPELMRPSLAWINLSEAKEAAGLERAMGAVGFGQGKFSAELLSRFQQFGTLQDAELKLAQIFVAKIWPNIVFAEASEKRAVAKLRESAKLLVSGESLGVTGPQWFQTSTAWIERLRQFETDLGREIKARAHSITLASKRFLYADISLTVFAVVITAFGGWHTMRYLDRGVGTLIHAMQRIASKDFDVPNQFLGENSEIGQLSDALDIMRSDLTAADQKIKGAYSRSFAFEGSGAAMMLIDPHMTILETNASLRDLIHEHSEIFGSAFDEAGEIAMQGRDMAVFHVFAAEQIALLRDKSKLPWRTDISIGDLKFELSASFVEGEDGSDLGNVLEWRNVTEERTSHGMISAIRKDQGVVEYDLSGRIMAINANFAKFIGMNEAALSGRHHTDLLHPEDSSGGKQEVLWAELANGRGQSGKIAALHADGTKVWMRVMYTPVLDSEGNAFKVVLFAEDITIGVENHARSEAERLSAEAARELVVGSLAAQLKLVADGDLDCAIVEAFPTEFEPLRLDFNAAISNLSNVVAAVVTKAGDLKSSAIELREASSNLAHRTESQAATLEETAAALEEITATVAATASGAKHADAEVKGAREGAERGGDTVASAELAMDQISTSSQQVSSIVSVIDEISFQTNLLALNAGVEAARAGDAGRGFAVVAQEVRGLAQRASEAAKEIGGLISESTDKVQEGVVAVESAGAVLNEISASVIAAAGRVQEIKVAADEQAMAISEINSAVSDMDAATQQNAAMVEEASALGTDLSTNADELYQLVSRFRWSTGKAENTASVATKLRVAG